MWRRILLYYIQFIYYIKSTYYYQGSRAVFKGTLLKLRHARSIIRAHFSSPSSFSFNCWSGFPAVSSLASSACDLSPAEGRPPLPSSALGCSFFVLFLLKDQYKNYLSHVSLPFILIQFSLLTSCRLSPPSYGCGCHPLLASPSRVPTPPPRGRALPFSRPSANS